MGCEIEQKMQKEFIKECREAVKEEAQLMEKVTIKKLEEWARDMLIGICSQHSVEQVFIEFKLIGRDTLGQCQYSEKASGERFAIIQMNPDYIPLQTEEKVKGILAHELAHALTYFDEGLQEGDGHLNPIFLDYLEKLGGTQIAIDYEHFPCANQMVVQDTSNELKNRIADFPHLEKLRGFVKFLCTTKENTFTNLFVNGVAGTGKTETILQVMKEENASWKLFSSHLTPFNFYVDLYNLNRRIKADESITHYIVFLDDISGLLQGGKNDSGIGLLKACLGRERKIEWRNRKLTTEYEVGMEAVLDPRIRFIMCSNQSLSGKNLDLQAIMNRGYNIEVKPTIEEILECIRQILEKKHEAEVVGEIMGVIEENADKNAYSIDLRLSVKASALYKDSEMWKTLLEEEIKKYNNAPLSDTVDVSEKSSLIEAARNLRATGMVVREIAKKVDKSDSWVQVHVRDVEVGKLTTEAMLAKIYGKEVIQN